MTSPHRPGSRTRDRRGRGLRGPALLPGASPVGARIPRRPTRRERFDRLALGIVTEIDHRWHHRLGLVEYAVEDTPMIPHDWDDATVPLSSLIRGSGSAGSRLVLFRRPIEQRCETRPELEMLVLEVVVTQIAELLGVPAEDVDPRYEADG